ncbi:P-loop containing nucleoside triphosphate hydrolase protein [Syncephalis plumigaleata]|nr:P-loop containing nucleoside triphosphate hydrolase protein [Syncephalis plumigaleata]
MSRSLTVVFTTLRTCFVNLPPAWSSALFDQTKHAGQIVLEVSWPSLTGEAGQSSDSSNRTYLAWAGGSSQTTERTSHGTTDILEIDSQFGRSIGLTSGQLVHVKFQRKVTMARTIQLEPYSSDDWEIMELHAAYFEEQLLNQVGVVYRDQLLTVWVQQRTLIRLRVVSTDPEEACVRLGVDVEVHIAPKVRQLTAPTSGSADKLPIARRIYPRLVGGNTLGGTTVLPSVLYVHPDTLPVSIDNNDECSSWISGQLVQVSTVQLDHTEKETMPIDEDRSECTIAALQVDKRVPPGVALGGSLVWSALKLKQCERVKVQLVKQSPLPANAVSFHLIDQAHTGSFDHIGVELATKALIASIPDWLLDQISDTTHNASAIWVDGTMLTCSRKEHQDPVHILVRVEPTNEKKQNEDGVPSKNDTSVSLLPPFATMDMRQWNEIEVTEIIHDAALTIPKGLSMPRLGGIDQLLEQAYTFVQCSLVASSLEQSIGTHVNGGLLLCGREGSGKSTVLDYLEYKTTKEPQLHAYWTRIDCRQLSEERPSIVSEKLQQQFDEAAWHAPSIICIDNIDRLCPAELEAKRFISIAQRMLSLHRILMVATCTQQAALHKLLPSSHLFQKILTISPPDKRQRYEILQCLQQEKQSVLSPNDEDASTLDLQQVANETEGYVAADLATLIDQAMQQAVIRSLSSISNSNNSNNSKDTDVPTGMMNGRDEKLLLNDSTELHSLQLTMADFTKAMESYTPSSLRGVKLATASSVAWSDIGGLHEARELLLETLEWPTKYARIFAHCPLRLRSGLLLYGYPGCGKTLLASAVAKECGLNFISVKGPELLNKYIGASEKSVRDLFERAKAARPSILFFDEFDSIAPRRGHDSTGVTDRVVNQMLTEMDGAEQLEGVYVLAATSRPDLIDPALLRPGRLDKSILCGIPNQVERQEILEAVASKLHLDPSIDINEIAASCENYTGADLQALLYNAHLEAAHESIEGKSTQVHSTTSMQDDGNYEETKVTSSSTNDNNDATTLKYQVSNRQHMTAAEQGQLSQRLLGIQQAHLDKEKGKSVKLRKKAAATSSQLQASIRIIGLQHVRKAIINTRPSLAEAERLRLTRIYNEFVDGRGGELADGTGTKGVGQRVTLG